ATFATDYDLHNSTNLALTTSVVIPVGQNSATVIVAPRSDNTTEGDEDAAITVATATAYLVGSPATATVHIREGLPVRSNIRLWLRSDVEIVYDANGKIDRWKDQSGNSNDALATTTAGSRPERIASASYGLPAVRFDGVDDVLTLPALMAGASAGEIFA